jgi:amino acid adenylation domain-containing protein
VNKQKRFEELLRKKGIHVPKGPQLIRRDQTGPFPLSFAQRRIWFLQTFEPGSAAYNDPTALRIKGPLNIPVLEKTFNEIIRRHQVLRMIFPSKDGQPVQTLHENDCITISVTSLQKVETDNENGQVLENQILDFVNRFSAQPFDISRDMLVRAVLLKIEEDDHALAVNIHHIVLDGWSKGIMLQELMDLYRAYNQSEPSPLKELPIQFTDYVYWHHEWMQSPLYHTQLDYWKEKLTGAPPVLELPFDFPRPAAPSGRGTLQPFSLTSGSLQQLNTLAQKEDVTLFMFLLTAFNILLYRYSGKEDILIGTPTAGRQWVEVEPLIGLFLNTLVIRTDLSGTPNVRTLLKRVRTTALEAYSHQDIPFEKLVEELNPRRDLSITPLFQVMFQLQNAPMPPARISGLTITPIQLDTGVAQVDLSLTIWEEEGGLKGTFEYSTDLYENATIARMIGHFKRLLESILSDVEKPVSHLSILSEEERQRLLIEWNQTTADYPGHLCIYQLFETCADENSDETAVLFQEKQLAYRELNQQANRLARFLIKLHIGPETLVGICIENSLQLITGIIGILKAGGAYIPMDPQYPDERLDIILKDACPPVLITLNRHHERFGSYIGTIFCLDSPSTDSGFRGESIENITNTCEPHHAACVIYTSGSTGIPKGILLENRSIVNLLSSFIESYKPGPADNILPLTSIASASFVGEILPILISGGTIVLADKIHFLDMNSLTSLLSRYEITILSTVPSLIARLNAFDADRWKPGKLRLLLSGGEALSAGDIDRLLKTVTIVNGYGLTEAAICSTFNIVNDLDFSKNPVISVGKPIINTRVYILDQYMNPVPIGIPGEIYVGGDGVSRGYLNHPERTTERFFMSNRSYFTFKTGDLGLWLADGSIKFLGRIDTQVQIHGHRIELSEIETILGLHPEIRDVVVIAREFIRGDRRLVAYLVTGSRKEFSSSQLREWLSKRIPEYMIPTVFETIEAIPLTVNGKVDIDALPVPSGVRPELDAAYKAPQTRMEKEIAALWQELLLVDKVGIDDNFFDLGGHSLLLTRVHSRLSLIVEKELTIVDLFRYPTVRSLSKFVSEEIGKNDYAVETFRKIQERANKQRQAFKRRDLDKRKQMLKPVP